MEFNQNNQDQRNLLQLLSLLFNQHQYQFNNQLLSNQYQFKFSQQSHNSLEFQFRTQPSDLAMKSMFRFKRVQSKLMDNLISLPLEESHQLSKKD